MSWFVLVIAGLFEIGWAVGLKYTEGFTRLWPTVGTVAAMAISVGLLGVAMKELPPLERPMRFGPASALSGRSFWE